MKCACGYELALCNRVILVRQYLTLLKENNRLYLIKNYLKKRKQRQKSVIKINQFLSLLHVH